MSSYKKCISTRHYFNATNEISIVTDNTFKWYYIHLVTHVLPIITLRATNCI